MTDATIVVTNDDGIESPGLRRLVEALEPLGDVTVVAPASNQSAVGRAIDASAGYEEHQLGYAVQGSPATCVVAAVTAFDLDPDIIVSGINKGANLGTAILGRSGTIGAAIEAAYLDIPSVAVSAFIPFERIQGDFHEYSLDIDEYEPAARVAHRLSERLLGGEDLEAVDYFSVNAPLQSDLRDPKLRITMPAAGYHTSADLESDQLFLRDRQFEMLHTGTLDTEGDTDRAALAAGDISISPLTLPEQVPSVETRSAVGHQLFGAEPWVLHEPAD